ncbi:MAG: hypothetical protein ACO3N7_04295 [Kiritimatiellia bacterium]
MKKLSPREIRLCIITGAVLLAGLSFVLLQRQFENLKGLERRELSARVERKQQIELLAQRPELVERLAAIKGQLPRHPEGQDLKSEFARQVQNLSNQSGLKLTGLTPDSEVHLEDLQLYQSSVRCTWSGSSEDLVRFLHRLNAMGAVADIRELRLRNRNGMSTTLSGSFVLDFVYSRVPPADLQAVIDSPPESADNPLAP